ncbi:MAG: hypothetical protein JW720_08420 [Sedimentisphaerales bacterium]|nr:hypothetical protein [Sedimentisphaerales bacterium]
MEASKCPVGMLWLILGIAVYRISDDQTDGTEDWPLGQTCLPKQDTVRSHIRPPPGGDSEIQ